MLCLACHRPCGTALCAHCRRLTQMGSDRLLPGGIRLIVAFEHTGPARTLVHHLKYRGITEYADLVASTLAPRLPRLPLVPVPRALTRRIRYGVDPAVVLASMLSKRLDVPVFPLLRAPVHSRRRAGGDHSRSVSGFKVRPLEQSPRGRPLEQSSRGRTLPGRVLVVDDVVTTGATLLSAIASLGEDRVHAAVAANAVAQVSSLRRRR